MLPTGFGNSLIHQSFVFGKEITHFRSALRAGTHHEKFVPSRRMSNILTHVRVVLATTGVQREKNRQLMRSKQWPCLNKTIQWHITTRKTVNRLPREQLHLNNVVPEQTKEV